MLQGGALAYAALDLARARWPVFPCHGKVPLTAHGHTDGTDDLAIVATWWKRWPRANIGARVPDGVVVVDVDPRSGGDQSLGLLEMAHGALPRTLRSFTGGGGEHRFFLRPPGPLHNGAHKLGPGLDVKLGGRGYVIVPPSVHPNGKPYRWDDANTPIAPMPTWLARLLRPEPPKPRVVRPSNSTFDGPRPGDQLAESVSWAEILEPHGWRHVNRRGDVNYWRRPGKSDGTSATTNALGTDRLYVFSSSAAPFEPDESYSKFGAWAMLNTGGDFSEAARRLRRSVGA